MQNIAYWVNLNNFSLLHIGDTDWDKVSVAMAKLQNPDRKLDVAILPYWLLLDPESINNVEQHIRPKYLIATHIPPDFPQTEIDQLKIDLQKSLYF